MKVDLAMQRYKEGALNFATVRKSPSNLDEWFIMVIDNHDLSFMIADNQGAIIVSEDLGDIFDILKSIGFSSAEVFFK